MCKGITWVALDTSKRKHVGAILRPGSRKVEEFSVPNETKAIRRLARKLVREASGEVRVCYEAGPCGYALQRLLEASGRGLVCEVVAPSLIPVRPGERIKTDRRDAAKLVRLYRAGELTAIQAPSETEEAVRDLVRCREDIKEDLQRARHRLSKLMLRRGRVYSGRSWTVKHRQWLTGQEWEEEADRVVFEEYRLAISQLEARLKELEVHLGEQSRREPYRDPVGWLRCFRGIDTVTAMTIVAELHDPTRFRDPRSLMGYVGIVPSEHSSGESRRRGAITKAGNAHVRRVLVEAAWSSRHKPAVGYQLQRRRQGQPAWVIAHADRAMSRLSGRYRRMRAGGKPANVVVTAVARELVGFVWVVLQEGRQRQEQSGSREPGPEQTAA